MPSCRKPDLSPLDSFSGMQPELEKIGPYVWIAAAEVSHHLMIVKLPRSQSLTRPDVAPLPIEESQTKQAILAAFLVEGIGRTENLQEMLSMSPLGLSLLDCGEPLVSECACEVVQPISFFHSLPINKTVLRQLPQMTLGVIQLQFPNRRRCFRIEGLGENGEQSPETPQLFCQQVVAQFERGFDRLELLFAFLEAAGILGSREVRSFGEYASRQSQRKRQPAAETSDLVSGVANSRSDPKEQIPRIFLGHLV